MNSKCHWKKSEGSNHAKHSRKLSKTDYRFPEVGSERVSTDINNFMWPSNYFCFRATYPTGKFYRKL